MAYAVIGGLLCSTALSLVFVPAMFVLMDNVSRFSSWLGSRLVSKSEPDALTDASRGPPGPPMERRAVRCSRGSAGGGPLSVARTWTAFSLQLAGTSGAEVRASPGLVGL